jgi:hypothetical protein
MPEVSGSSVFTSATKVVDIVVSSGSVDLIKLPLSRDNTGAVSRSTSYVVNYTFNGAYTRQGQISINVNSPSITSSEEFTCNATSANGIKLDFTVAIDNNSIVISYTNDLTSNEGTLTYSYTAIS